MVLEGVTVHWNVLKNCIGRWNITPFTDISSHYNKRQLHTHQKKPPSKTTSMLLPTKVNALTKALREPNTMLSLSTMRSLLIFHLILLMLLQLILSKASQDSPTDRAENPMASLMPGEATSKAASDGAADTTLAVSGLFAVLGILWSWSVLVGDSEIGHWLEREMAHCCCWPYCCWFW